MSKGSIWEPFLFFKKMIDLKLLFKSIETPRLQLSCLVLISLSIFFLYYPIIFFKSYDGKRELQVLIVILSHFLLFSSNVFERYAQFFISLFLPVRLFLLLFFISGFIAALFSEYSFYAWGDLLHTFFILNTVFIIYSFFCSYPKTKTIILSTMFIGICLLHLEFIFRSLIGLYLDGQIKPNMVYPSFANYRFLNQVQIQFIFIFIYLTLVAPLVYRKYLFFFSVVSIFMLLISGARGALLSLVLVLSFIFLFIRNVNLKRIFLNSIIILVLGIILFGVYLAYENLVRPLDSGVYILRSNSSGRLSMWYEAIYYIINNPIGIGPYQYGTITKLNNFSHPHNSIIQFVLEWGWLAAVAIFSLILYFFLYVVSLFRKENNILKLSLASSLLAGILYSLFSGVFVMPASQITFVILSAYLLSENYKELKSIGCRDLATSMVDVNKKLKIIYKVIIFLLTLFYLFFLYRSYHLKVPFSQYQSDAKVPLTTGPRIWVEGGIVDSSEKYPIIK